MIGIFFDQMADAFFFQIFFGTGFKKQIDLRTSYGSSTPDYLRAFELLRSGAVDFSVLVETYPLLQAEKGFIDSDNLEAMKVLLDCSR